MSRVQRLGLHQERPAVTKATARRVGCSAGKGEGGECPGAAWGTCVGTLSMLTWLRYSTVVIFLSVSF